MKRLSLLLTLLLLLSPLRAEAADEATPPPEAPPGPTIRLLPEEGLPLPSERYPLTEKRGFAFGGTVESDAPLTYLSVAVSDQQGEVLLLAEAEPDADDPAAMSFPLWDRTFPYEDVSLSARTDFASLKPGKYVFTLTAASADTEETVLYTSPFTVERTSARHTLNPNDLQGIYPSAAAYLGAGVLPFTYRSGTFGRIQVDNGWVKRNIVELTVPFASSTWRVNKAAVGPFTQALGYLRNTYIHVGGASDSGILRLSRLVHDFAGPFLAREEERDSRFLSPHVLGLSIDMNGGIGLNEAVAENWATFCKEISENLIYNGIQESRGYRYYDFTYVGSWASTYERVPTILQNYLLYELAFYRAGFFWGVYYDHTCDASHFGLGEYDPQVHTDSPLALRKVFEYIDG